MAEPKRKAGGRGRSRPKKMKTAVILQGGASRGAHQVGALKYLDEIGVKPDLLIGSSIGVINACLYATGGINQMEKFWSSFRTHPLVPGLSLRENIFMGNSLLSMQWAFSKIERFIDFDKIFRSRTEVAFILTNLSKGVGELRSNRTEKAPEDLRAVSRIGYTIPGLYPPIKYQGGYWCDGGFVWNVPLEYALQEGATRIFMLLCVGRNLPKQHRFGNIYQVLARFYDIMWVHVASGGTIQRDFTHSMYKGAEIHIVEPSTYLEGFGMLKLMMFSPEKAKRFIEQGYSDARDQLGEL